MWITSAQMPDPKFTKDSYLDRKELFPRPSIWNNGPDLAFELPVLSESTWE